MPGKLLLDTCAVIALFRQHQAVVAIIAATQEVFVSTITLGELYYGARTAQRAGENRAQVDAFAATCTTLACSEQTAMIYADVKFGLKTKGRPIPENDIWIAAVARQFSLPLLSIDRHFADVDGITLETW